MSRSYVERPWPQHEWSIALREAQNRSEEFILPIRLDDSQLVGLISQVAYIHLSNCSVDEAAKLLFEKLTHSSSAEVSRWAATFGLALDNLFESSKLPPTAPTDYPLLCDWLADDLLSNLQSSNIRNARVIEDSRNGETFSVGVGFDWKPKEGPLQFMEPEWWEVLEVLPYDPVYES